MITLISIFVVYVICHESIGDVFEHQFFGWNVFLLLYYVSLVFFCVVVMILYASLPSPSSRYR